MKMNTRNNDIAADAPDPIQEARLWCGNGWTARVVKNEDDEGWAVEMILDGESEQIPLDDMVQRAVAMKPDLIGFTATSPFFHLSKTVAEGIKRLAPDIPIVVGGPHITIMKEQALLGCFDYAFIGEAEESWPQLLVTVKQT